MLILSIAFSEDYSESILPQHTHLRLVANSEQLLAGNTARRLLTYEKCLEYSGTVAPTSDSTKIPESTQEFRERYFNTNGTLESRQDRRMRKAAQREEGRLQMELRGKLVIDGRAKKCDLNKARFD